MIQECWIKENLQSTPEHAKTPHSPWDFSSLLADKSYVSQNISKAHINAKMEKVFLLALDGWLHILLEDLPVEKT